MKLGETMRAFGENSESVVNLMTYGEIENF